MFVHSDLLQKRLSIRRTGDFLKLAPIILVVDGEVS